MAKSILIVDDEAGIRKTIARYLKKEGHQVFEACDGVDALEIMENEAIDMVILDLMMPRLNGEGFIQAVRRSSDVYIIVLTARTGEDSQVSLYGLGADDYVEKPFGCKALTSKVSAVLNRLSRKIYGQCTMQAEGLVIDSQARRVCLDGVDLRLKPKEYELLQFLICNPNHALSREQLLNGVWGSNYFGYDRTVDSHISHLRKKLARLGENIKTVSGFGYKWET